jgi:hypothetical protein
MLETQGGHGSMPVGETNKLVGSSNYYIWQFKMKVILKRDSMCHFTKTHIQPDYFLTTILGTQYTRHTMRKAKDVALSKMLLFVVDNLFGFLSTFSDPPLAYDVLCRKFAFDNQSHLLTLINQLHILECHKEA